MRGQGTEEDTGRGRKLEYDRDYFPYIQELEHSLRTAHKMPEVDTRKREKHKPLEQKKNSQVQNLFLHLAGTRASLLTVSRKTKHYYDHILCWATLTTWHLRAEPRFYNNPHPTKEVPGTLDSRAG